MTARLAAHQGPPVAAARHCQSSSGQPAGTMAYVTDTADRPAIVVAGLDPGLANLGLGAIREVGRETQLIASELIRTRRHMAHENRLERLYRATRDFLTENRPQALAVEGQYFHHQRDTAFKVGQVVGVCLLAACQQGVAVFEYGPMQVKQTLVGSGQADKYQVAYMVRALLGVRRLPGNHHITDALALALTHLSFRRLGSIAQETRC